MGVFDETIVVIEDDEPVAVGTFARRAHLVNEDGTAFSGGSGASDVPDGSVTTAKIADGAVTSEKLAEGVIPEVPAAPTADTIEGATDIGRSLMKAESAEAARTAIGAGTSSFSGSYNDLTDKPTIPEAYELPTATAEALGGVKKAAAVADATDDAVGTLNALLASLRAAGMVEASA